MKVLLFSATVMMIASGAATAAPRSLWQVIDSLSLRYDRIESYSADADVFEYDG